ncbi:MAG: hypothetical protein KDA22_16655 [Phycisphaerales bacterium]|nr:hypothetical protein [Phycisphaerales bacterium]
MDQIRTSTLRPIASTDRAALVAAPILLLAVAGCTGNLNTSDDLIGGDPVVTETAVAGTDAMAPDQPSLLGLDRRNWPVQRVTSPPAQVEFNPTYVEPVLVDDTTARNRGDYPSFATMLEETGSSEALAWQAIATIPYNGWLLLISPIRMVQTPPDSIERGPGGYRRMPPVPTVNPWAWVEPPGSTPTVPAADTESPPTSN